MSFRTGHVAGFAAALSAVLAGTMLLPGPYGDGVGVDHRTGAALPQPWRELADLRAAGDLGVLRTRLAELAGGGTAISRLGYFAE